MVVHFGQMSVWVTPSPPRLVGFHIGSQELIDVGLVALALGFKPIEYVFIHTKSKLFFTGSRFQPFANHRLGKHLWGDFWTITLLDIFVIKGV